MQKTTQNSQTNTLPNGIDKIDAQIIEILRTDARIPNTRLAEKIGLSPTATQARVERLQHDGIIRYYSAIVDNGKLVGENLAFVQVTLNNTSAAALREFNQAAQQIPEIEECHMVASNFDYLLKVRSRDMNNYRYILAERISGLPYVRHTSTYIVMQAVKDLGVG